MIPVGPRVTDPGSHNVVPRSNLQRLLLIASCDLFPVRLFLSCEVLFFFPRKRGWVELTRFGRRTCSTVPRPPFFLRAALLLGPPSSPGVHPCPRSGGARWPPPTPPSPLRSAPAPNPFGPPTGALLGEDGQTPAPLRASVPRNLPSTALCLNAFMQGGGKGGGRAAGPRVGKWGCPSPQRDGHRSPGPVRGERRRVADALRPRLLRPRRRPCFQPVRRVPPPSHPSLCPPPPTPPVLPLCPIGIPPRGL